jgi:ketosteroid isomerase-like protein
VSQRSAVDVVREYGDAWVRGDAAAVIAMYADDVVLHYFGDNPIAGEHRGRAALAILGRYSQAVKRGAPEIHDVFGSEEHAVMLARERWGEGDDAVELDRVFLYHVRDGKLAECWAYDGDQRLVDRILTQRLG